MPFVRKRMTPFAQDKPKLERPAWKLETARTAGRCERAGDACDPGAFSCFTAAFSRLRRRVRNRVGLSARPMVTSQALRVSPMPDLLALCADWLRLVAGVFFVFCGAVFACGLGKAQVYHQLRFLTRSKHGATSASNRFAVFTPAAGNRGGKSPTTVRQERRNTDLYKWAFRGKLQVRKAGVCHDVSVSAN